MGFLSKKEYIKCLYLHEDYRIEPMSIPVDDMASEILTIKKDGKRYMSWPLIHELMKPIYGFPGIRDGTKVLIICPRDIIFDPLNELDKTWSKEKIKEKMPDIAKEQQYKVEKSSMAGILSRSMAFLSASAFILFLAIVIIGIIKFTTNGD